MNEETGSEAIVRIRPAVIEKAVSDTRIKKILEKILSLFPFTFIGRQTVERLADELDEIFWIKDSEGTLLLVNKLFADTFGLEKIQIEGKNYTNFIPSSQITFFKFIEQFMKESLNCLSLEGDLLDGFNLPREKRLLELPLIDNINNILVLVGFSSSGKQNQLNKIKIMKEETISDLIDKSAKYTAIINFEGYFKNSTKEFCKLFGRNFDEISNLNFTEVFPELLSIAVNDFIQSDDDGIIIELDENLEISSSTNSSYKLQLKQVSAAGNKKKEVYIGIEKPDKILTSDQLLKSKGKMYEILIRSNPEPIFIYDEENLSFLEVNDSALLLYGYTKDEFLQMDLTDLYTPEDIQNLLETSEEILKEGEFSKPYRHRQKDGNFVYVRISKIKFKYEEKDAVFNIVRDVTETLDLEKNSLIYKTAFYNSGDSIFLTDSSGIITYSNNVALNQLGLSKDELVNSSLTSLCEGEDRALLNSAIFQSHLKEPVTIDIQLKTKNGNFIETELVATPVLNINSEVDAFSILAKIKPSSQPSAGEPKEIIKEIVKEVVVEKPIKQESESTQLDSSFLSSVFHEILTPMNVILGFAQELTESIDKLSPEQQEAVDIINQNRSSLLSIMNSIIEYSEIHQKKSELEVEEVGITEVVEPLDRNIRDVTGLSDVEFAYGKISSSLKFETDRKRFEGMVNNLMRMVSKITDQKKIYFSAYPTEEGKFNINISDNFARSSSTLFDSLSKLFIERKEPKEVGVSKLNFQMINSLLNILGGKFVVFGDSNGQQDCAFSFPMKLTSEIEPEIIEEKSVVETIEEEPVIESVEEKLEIPVITEEELSKEKPEPFIEKEHTSEKKQEPIVDKEEIEIEEEIVETEEEIKTELVNTDVPAFEKHEVVAEEPVQEPAIEEEISIEEKAPAPEGDYTSKLSCLYIEDQIDSQILFKVQMKGLKNIQFAASFEEAVPLLDTNKFDFIVMDINLQGEYNGLDALKAIHQMPGFENIPIIAVTAYVLPGDREKFIATGFTDFISKPIFREKMFESLKKIFAN
jgi:PAS domain S-box-containing protein